MSFSAAALYYDFVYGTSENTSEQITENKSTNEKEHVGICLLFLFLIMLYFLLKKMKIGDIVKITSRCF